MMMLKRRPRRSELYDRILGIDAARKKAAQRIEKNIEKLFADYFARVKAMVGDPRELKAGDAANAASTVKMMTQLESLLIEAGFEDVIEKYVDEFPTLTKAALQYYTAFGAIPSLAGVSTETLDAYIRFTEGKLRDIVTERALDPVRTALLRVNFAGAPREAVYQEVALLEETLSLRQVEVMVDEAFSSFQRAVLVETADALEVEIYQYIGPDDEITSEQCEEMLHVDYHGVEGMLYKDEITVDLHEKLTRDPLTGGGHPNCRHHWSPVTADYAESLGFELRGKKEQEAA